MRSENEIVALTNLYANGFIAKNTVPDGNCGAEMEMAFTDGMKFALLSTEAHDDAPREVILQILAATRQELQESWCEVSHLPFWQELWLCSLEEQVDMAPWHEKYLKKDMPEPSTPPVSKKDMPAPSNPPDIKLTPERPAPRQRVSLTGVPSRQHSGNFVVPNISGPKSKAVSKSGDPDYKKPKPTGKASDISDTITVEILFGRFLQDHGFTWRSFMSVHAKTVTIVCLGRGDSGCKHGVYADVVKLLVF
jgi:hypothetical protein